MLFESFGVELSLRCSSARLASRLCCSCRMQCSCAEASQQIRGTPKGGHRLRWLHFTATRRFAKPQPQWCGTGAEHLWVPPEPIHLFAASSGMLPKAMSRAIV